MTDVVNRITLLKLARDGFFSFLSRGECVRLRHENGVLVDVTNLPEGMWPFALAHEDGQCVVYFTYFLSTQIGRWSSNEGGVSIFETPKLHIQTAHGTLLAIDPIDGRLKHINRSAVPSHQLIDDQDCAWPTGRFSNSVTISVGPLNGYSILPINNIYESGKDDQYFHLLKNDHYLCAEPILGKLAFDRSNPGPWEAFKFVTAVAEGMVTFKEKSELSEFLRRNVATDPDDQNMHWLYSKFVTGAVIPEAYAPDDLEPFYRIERLGAMLALDGQTSARMAFFVEGLSSFSVALNVGVMSASRLIEVPAEKYTPVLIAPLSSRGEIGIHPRLPEKIELSSVTILNTLVDDINSAEAQSGTCYNFVGFADINDLDVKIGLTKNKKSTSSYQELDIFFSALLTLDPKFDAGRIKFSLMCLSAYLGEFFDSEKSQPFLHLNFADRGSERCISFDRVKGSFSPLIPDLYMLSERCTRRYFVHPSLRTFANDFRSKDPILFWRGSTTGSFPNCLEEFKNNPRVSACIKIRDLLGSKGDARITNITQISQSIRVDADNLVQQLGISAPRIVPEREFGRYQMYIDLPGNSCAWGTYRKYLMGCLIIRPNQTSELSYHKLLEPGIHFLAVSESLDDLPGVVEWVLEHPIAAARIAFAGRELMMQVLDDVPHAVLREFRSAAKYESC